MSRLSDMDYARIAEEHREVVWSEIRAGYGVEDIKVRHNVPEWFSRQCIKHWRKRGVLRALIRGLV